MLEYQQTSILNAGSMHHTANFVCVNTCDALSVKAFLESLIVAGRCTVIYVCSRCMIPVEILTGSFLVAVIAMLVPFFNDVVGLLGALGFWPLTVFLPIQMHLKQAGLFSFAAFQWPCLPYFTTWLLLLLPIISVLCALHHLLQLLQQCVATASSLLLYLLLWVCQMYILLRCCCC